MYNKVDRLTEDQQLDVFLAGDGIAISARDRDSLDPLLDAIDRFLVMQGRADTIPTLTLNRADLSMGASAWEPRPDAADDDGSALDELSRDDDGFVDFSN